MSQARWVAPSAASAAIGEAATEAVAAAVAAAKAAKGKEDQEKKETSKKDNPEGSKHAVIAAAAAAAAAAGGVGVGVPTPAQLQAHANANANATSALANSIALAQQRGGSVVVGGGPGPKRRNTRGLEVHGISQPHPSGMIMDGHEGDSGSREDVAILLIYNLNQVHKTAFTYRGCPIFNRAGRKQVQIRHLVNYLTEQVPGFDAIVSYWNPQLMAYMRLHSEVLELLPSAMVPSSTGRKPCHVLNFFVHLKKNKPPREYTYSYIIPLTKSYSQYLNEGHSKRKGAALAGGPTGPPYQTLDAWRRAVDTAEQHGINLGALYGNRKHSKDGFRQIMAKYEQQKKIKIAANIQQAQSAARGALGAQAVRVQVAQLNR